MRIGDASEGEVASPNSTDNLSDEDKHKYLVRFLDDEDALQRVASFAGRFNFFDATGIARRELRHSDLLAYLQNPNQNHGLGDRFLRRFLSGLVRQSSDGCGLNLPILDLQLC